MTTWFTSDLHLGHANIIQYCDRPFADVDEMNEALIERWNAVVRPDDTIWVLGDVAMGTIHDSLALVGRLHGHKHLLSGNHDRCWLGHGQKAHGWPERYVHAGFTSVHHGAIHVKVAGRDALACHFPYRGDSQEQDRYIEHRPRDRGDWLLHGHVHERWMQHDRMINVGVDGWDCTPVAEERLAELIEIGPDDRTALPFTRRAS